MKNDASSNITALMLDEAESFAPLCWVKNPFHQVIDTQCSSCGKLSAACQQEDYAVDFILCELGCGATYCSNKCRDVAMNCNQHAMLCVGPYDETHPIYKLKLLALQSGPQHFSTIHLAATLVVCCSCYCLDESEDIMIVLDDEALSLFDTTVSTSDCNVAFVGTYELVVDIMSQDGRRLIPTQLQWQRILHAVSRCKRTGTTKSPFATECERLTLSEEWSPHSYLLGASAEGATTLIELMDEPAHFFPDTAWTALYSRKLTHSCIPSHDVQSICNGVQEMKLNRIAKANEGETVATISMIDNTQCLDLRTEEMDEKGLGRCNCLRCVFERDPSVDVLSLSMLQGLLDLATLQERYDDAMDAIEAIVRLDPTSPISLFTRARIAGWQNDFVRREELLLKAVRTCGHDKDIGDALVEANAYYRKTSNAKRGISPHTPNWDTVDGLEGSVFIAENILDLGECTRMIAAVEEYQQKHRCGNWSTSRHYSVPTTDLPLCLVPEL